MLLEVKDVSSGYGDVQVLSGITINVDAGEIVSIVGANGAGKTTLIRAIMGTLPVTKGQIQFDGKRIDGLAPHLIARAGIAQVMEGRRLFGHMEVEDNLLVGGDILNDKAQQRQNLDWIYSMFPRLKERRRQLARSFSGGEQQMLAIGRALMTSPKLLLLDEPSIGLAPIMVKDIFEKLPLIQARGVTILLVEQDVHRSLSMSGRGYVMEHGEIVLAGTGQELLSNERLRQAYMGI
ncbi:ABC transporter ATP-binding protein [Advenella mimigardefordensis]|uniref:High-affinity branched-chain amino acid transport ATP-binding protein BraG n=1 Tax=Advenella mimigardefordensis (strain DSM 17166 / LMG 22922 / DPN7) TaxID=1247726 RepID=W0P663_ADVMD|nr:ABC transporter ATP-binding protein [Advenella mimigardefordensis]AHG62221.1 high-affinity branched-chain amino acid transport ATP-binding protein BraG [Advenella mimigardefordensis DPN7]